MSKRGSILWQGLVNPSMELFKAAASDQGFELEGLILQAHEDRPYAAYYTIRVDESWRTRDVAIEIELEDGGRRSVAISADAAGTWTRDGQRMSELDDCVDADLEWSPSTNTLPIRRLAMAPGQTRTIAAAWIRFPSLEVQRLDQSYERLDQRRYRYRSGLFTADLVVDDDGMVLQYGVNWKAVATGA